MRCALQQSLCSRPWLLASPKLQKLFFNTCLSFWRYKMEPVSFWDETRIECFFFLRVKPRPDFTEAQLDYKQLQNADRQAKVQRILTSFKSFAKQKPRKSEYTYMIYLIYTYSCIFVLISEKRKKTGFRSCRFCIVIFWQSFNHHLYFMIYHAICFRGGFLRTAFGKSSVIRSSLYPFVTLFQFHALWETTAKGHAIKAAGWSDKVGNGVTAMAVLKRFKWLVAPWGPGAAAEGQCVWHPRWQEHGGQGRKFWGRFSAEMLDPASLLRRAIACCSSFAIWASGLANDAVEFDKPVHWLCWGPKVCV